MIPQEADQTHIEYGFPVVKSVCELQSSQVSGHDQLYTEAAVTHLIQ